MSLIQSIFKQGNVKLLMQLNIVSIIIIAFCEAFVVFTFLTKGQNPEIERWKYLAIIVGLVIISGLFIGSIISLIAFFRMKNKN